MNKDMLNSWMAKAGEHKIAIGVAAVCTVAILGSLIWPHPKPQPPISAVKTTAPTSPAFNPQTPAPQPAPAPAVKQAAPASAPAPAAPSTMEQELQAKPLFPSSSQAPAPKPAPAPTKPAAPTPKTTTPAPVAAPAPTPKQAVPAPKPVGTPHPVPVSAIPAGYYVQLGSFKNRDGAQALARKTAGKHWSTYVAPRPGGLHAVWVGPYRTRTEVDQAKQQLHQAFNISGFVVQSR